MAKFINIITQIIIVLGCCAILIFTLSIAIAFAKNDFATITNIYDYIYMLNISMKLNHKIDLMKEINQEIGEVGNIQHRIILRYENEFIPVIKNIIEDFNLTNNIKS